MSKGPTSSANDYSKALSGASEQLFPAADYNSFEERYVHNPSTTNSLAINPTGGAAALNTAGSITLAPGAEWRGQVTNAINVIGTLGQGVTAFQR